MWASYRSHGDPYPLAPDWIESCAEAGRIPFPRRGAWSARALNTLALQRSNSDFDKQLRTVPPNRPQQAVAARILKGLTDAGEQPDGLTSVGAFESLGGGKSLYDEEPKNLAQFDFNKLKVVQSKLNPRSLQDMLPEKSSEELIDQGSIDITPYWDPKLKHDKSERRRLIVALANQGLITFRRKIKEKTGLFFVKKKTPEWIRMVVDARRVNASHQAPPATRLSTPRSFLDLQLPPTSDGSPMGFGIEADVCDCFYNYYSEQLASWFGIDMLESLGSWVAAGWKETPLFDDELQDFCALERSTPVYPVFRGLCMGWSWSLFFANESVAFITSGSIPRPLQEIRDKAPLPSIVDGPITGVYVDNISIIGRTFEETKSAADKIAKHFDKALIPLTWTTPEPQSVFETVGIIIDFNTGDIRNKPKRVWRAFLAGQEILRRKKLPTKVLEVWLGHMTSIFMVTPCALSCFFHIYRYIQSNRDKRSTLWAVVRAEIRTALGLVWLASSSCKFDTIRQLDVGDSSSGAYALVTTWASVQELSHIVRWRETWRYQPMPIELKQAAETGSRDLVLSVLKEMEGGLQPDVVLGQEVRPSAPFGAGMQTAYANWLLELVRDKDAWQKTSSMASQFRARSSVRKAKLESPTLVPPIPDSVLNQNRYSLLWRKRWRSTDWHINIKEAAVALSSLRRTARTTSLHGKLKVTLTDNLAALFAFERGRSSSWRLNLLCGQACAYSMGSGIRWRLRHVETLRNPADRDSRYHEQERNVKSWIKQHRKQQFHDKSHDIKPSQVDSASATGDTPSDETSVLDDGVGTFSGQHQSNSSAHRRNICGGRNGIFLELFSGSGRLTAAVKQLGCACLTAVDITGGKDFDLRRRSTQLVILAWIKSGRIKYVHLGTPCTVFSRARHNIKNMQRAHDREREGVEFALFSAEIIETCERYSVWWSLENPRYSRLFQVPFLQNLLFAKHVVRVDLDFCRFGENYMKPTSIFSNLGDLQKLEKRCNHKKHDEVLRGSERVFLNGHWTTAPRTQRAGAYPLELVATWAQIISPAIVIDSRATDELDLQWRAELNYASSTRSNKAKSVQSPAGWLSITERFEEIIPQGIDTIAFGLHTTKEESRRRRKAKKFQGLSVKEMLGGLYQK